jgi:hypothetical protein
MDFMVKPTMAKDGSIYPAYSSFNDDDYKIKDTIQIIYSMKANGPLNSKIHGNCYSMVYSGKVHFLIKE